MEGRDVVRSEPGTHTLDTDGPSAPWRGWGVGASSCETPKSPARGKSQTGVLGGALGSPVPQSSGTRDEPE